MTEAVTVALISLVGTIITVVLANRSTLEKVTNELHTQNMVQNVKIENLTEEVKKHNEFAVRIPKLEGELKVLDERLKAANTRIKDLEARP